jgi:phosphoglycolate phosphatase
LNKQFSSFDLYIFDLDGTLIDSHRQIELALNEARMERGYPRTPKNTVWENLGKPVHFMLQDLQLTEAVRSDLIALFREKLADSIALGNDVFPYAERLLLDLRASKKKIALATGRSTKMAKLVVQHSKLFGLFDFIQGTDGFAPKPDPTVIEMCKKNFNLAPTLMVGDRVVDIEAANGANISSIGIGQSADSTVQLLGSGATMAFNSIRDFYNFLYH